MKLLIVSATEAEIWPLLAFLKGSWTSSGELQFKKQKAKIHICITGVGMVATTYALTRKLSLNKYDFALQVGIGGSYDTKLPLGKVVMIASDRFADMGAEDHENYLDLFELGLLKKNDFPFSNGRLPMPKSKINEQSKLQKVRGLTVNTVSGSIDTIKKRKEKFNCKVESMEGAAFHYVCLQQKIPFAQVRSISNYVEPRDKSKWKIKDAIINLNEWLIALTERL